jgi:quinoprotein glucose dehydrogenase
MDRQFSQPTSMHTLSKFPAATLLTICALSLSCGSEAPPITPGGPSAGWPSYGGDPGGSRYSPLEQITPENVAYLEVAWAYRTGDYSGGRPAAQGKKTTFQATPILDQGTLYFCSGLSRAFAIDAETGEERWVYDSKADLTGTWSGTCRGVALWRGEDARAPGRAAPLRGEDTRAPECGRRIFMGTMDGRLIALDAATGSSCQDFGVGGTIDLRAGLGQMDPGESYPTSPPTVIGDMVTIGALVKDNQRVDAPGGVIRGYDVRSGELRWAFDPVPPGTPPLAPARDGTPRYHRGTPNAWSIFSADPKRGLLFIPFGAPSPDFVAAHRKGFDHYANSVVALDARNGEVVWFFQAVHHDVWDYDIASQPTLIEIVKEGRRIPALVQATKMGHLFLLDRRTGKPIYEVEERPVPQTDVPGEITAPTQPFPTFPPPLHPSGFSPDEVFGLTPWDRGACRDFVASLRNEGIFTPPSLEGSLHYPGTAGGANWGGVAYDPARQLLVLNQNRLAQWFKLIPRAQEKEAVEKAGPFGVSVQKGAPYLAEHRVLLSPLGIPCSPRPWGTLLAVSLASGEVNWEVPFGSLRDMTPIPLPFKFGLPSMGGPILTASGLVFIGAAMDDYLRAYAVESGEELWRARLPAGGQATPMTYRLDEQSRQYIVIAAGGHSTMGTTPGDHVIAFALPEATR